MARGHIVDLRRRTADAGICAHGGAHGSACWASLNDSVRRPLGVETITDQVWPAGYARRERGLDGRYAANASHPVPRRLLPSNWGAWQGRTRCPRTVIDAVRWRGDQGVLSLRCSPRFFKVHVGQIYGTVYAGWGRILVPTLRPEAAGAGPFFRDPRIRLRRCPWSSTTTL